MIYLKQFKIFNEALSPPFFDEYLATNPIVLKVKPFAYIMEDEGLVFHFMNVVDREGVGIWKIFLYRKSDLSDFLEKRFFYGFIKSDIFLEFIDRIRDELKEYNISYQLRPHLIEISIKCAKLKPKLENIEYIDYNVVISEVEAIKYLIEDETVSIWSIWLQRILTKLNVEVSGGFYGTKCHVRVKIIIPKNVSIAILLSKLPSEEFYNEFKDRLKEIADRYNYKIISKGNYKWDSSLELSVILWDLEKNI